LQLLVELTLLLFEVGTGVALLLQLVSRIIQLA